MPTSQAAARGTDTRIRIELAEPGGPGSGNAEYRISDERERFSVEVEDILVGPYCVEVEDVILMADLDVVDCGGAIGVVGDLNLDSTFDAADLAVSICANKGEREPFEEAAALVSLVDCVRVFRKIGDICEMDVALQSAGCPEVQVTTTTIPTTSTTLPTTSTTLPTTEAETPTADACQMCVIDHCNLQCGS